MTVRVTAVFILLGSLWASASAQALATRYISDETAITLREDKGMNAPVAALLKSGTRVELIEEDAAGGYARVRVAQGREGWVLARYLSTEPAARERLAAAQSEIAAQQTRLRQLENEVTRLRDAAAAASSADRTRRASGESAPAATANAARPEIDASEPVVMFTGAALFIAGLLTGLLVSMLPRSRPRR